MKKIDIKKLINIVGENNATNNPADLYSYSSDASVHQAMPGAVVRPESVCSPGE